MFAQMKKCAAFTFGTGITIGVIIPRAYRWKSGFFVVGLDKATDLFQAAPINKWYYFIDHPLDNDTVHVSQTILIQMPKSNGTKFNPLDQSISSKPPYNRLQRITTSKLCTLLRHAQIIRIRIHLLACRNLLWDILRLPSSRRAALGLYVILML